MSKNKKLIYNDFKNWPSEDLAGGGSGVVISSPKTGKPIIFKYGAAAKIVDFENNQYLDYFLCDSALILGHGHKNILTATKVAIERGGINFGGLSRDEAALAHELKGKIPSVEKFSFFASEGEALQTAAQWARLSTGRKMCVTFDSCYGSRFLTDSAVVNLPYGDFAAFKHFTDEHRQEIAGIIIEPIPTYRGDLKADDAFLKMTIQFAKNCSALLIADEITTGFRAGPGSVCQQFNLPFDLICLGHVIGGGFSLGAVGGKMSLMDSMVKYRTNTMPLSPVILRSGLASLKLLDRRFYKSLDDKVAILRDSIERKMVDLRLTCQGSLLNVILQINQEEKYQIIWQKLFNQGILFQPDYRRPFSISALHTKKDLIKAGEILVSVF
ncbi:MAG: aminotransferase class III-fold pyridoxal phosphate-dependent enzyme [Candidatus Omnitrophica bacterium]|nr:aminotransferase class III-fold pyridoxal phosphate-dependent enzyme [Candidatus Omnitrophota bacterium]